MKWFWPVFCRKIPLSVVVRNWKRMSPEVAASKVGSAIVASVLRKVTMLSKRAETPLPQSIAVASSMENIHTSTYV